MASLSRRSVLALAPAGILVACGDGKMRTTVSRTPKLDIDGLNKDMAAIAETARADALGVGLMNLESGEAYTFNGDRLFPMQSVFKMLLGAYALSEVDAGRLSLDETIALKETDLSPPFSPIAQAWPGRKDYTVRELLEQAVSVSDNTAADVLMKRTGGPGALTAWLASRRVAELRVDRYERELQPEVYALGSFRPAWRTPEAFLAAREAVPAAVRAKAMHDYLLDPRDTATPRGMLEFLHALNRHDVISAGATRALLNLMIASPSGPGRIKAGMPKDAVVAHKTGTSGTDQGMNPATNDVGVFTLADKRSYALAVFLAGSTLDDAGRDEVIAKVASAAVRGVR